MVAGKLVAGGKEAPNPNGNVFNALPKFGGKASVELSNGMASGAIPPNGADPKPNGAALTFR